MQWICLQFLNKVTHTNEAPLPATNMTRLCVYLARNRTKKGQLLSLQNQINMKEKIKMAKPITTVKRFNTSMREPDIDNLEKVSEITGLSPNDAIRKALATEAFVQEKLNTGKVMYFRNPDGTFQEVAFVN